MTMMGLGKRSSVAVVGLTMLSFWRTSKVILCDEHNPFIMRCSMFQTTTGCMVTPDFETGDEMSRRAKFAFITWIGPGVSPLKKAKVSTDKAFVKEICRVSL